LRAPADGDAVAVPDGAPMGDKLETGEPLRPHVLREYSLLADGERGALVGPRGDITWLCVPHWDSPSLFSAMIGGAGHYTMTPSGPYVWGGFHEPGSLIWHGRWTTLDGTIESREALAMPADPGRAVVLRRVWAVDGPAAVNVVLRPRAEYDREPMKNLRHEDGRWLADVGPLRLRWSGAADAEPIDGGSALLVRLRLEPGWSRDLVLELSAHSLPDPPQADLLWQETETAWHDEVPEVVGTLAPRDARHSLAVIRGLTSQSGGMVAAATTSLPERAEAGRNYDYRYVWIRDQCFAGQACLTVGALPMLRRALDVVTARLLEHGDQTAPAYCISGAPVPRERHLDLPGYPGGFDIVGNWVTGQFQLDVFGEALMLYAAAHRHDLLGVDDSMAIDVAAEAIGRRWMEPDAGIWELKPRPWTHSRLTAAAGLRAVADLPRRSRGGVDRAALADHIIADTAKSSLHASGRWQRSPRDPGLDAALLLPSIRRAVPPEDPRSVETLGQYLESLTQDGYAYRFRHDARPLEDAEGSFLLCGFVVALSLADHGRTVEARAWFERTRASCGPPALFSEEYDVRLRQMRGNLPQGFVHALMLETAARLNQDG